MLIVYERSVLNLDKVIRFYTSSKNIIRFFCDSDNFFDLYFASDEERDKAFDRIINSYHWQRQICDLNDLK